MKNKKKEAIFFVLSKKKRSLELMLPHEHAIKSEFIRFLLQEKIYTPKKKGSRGRPPMKLGDIVLAIMNMSKEGWTYRKIPSKYGFRSTIHYYYAKWARAGVFERFQQYRVRKYIEKAVAYYRNLIIDGSDIVTKCMNLEEAQIGYKYKGKSCVKMMLICNTDGVPLNVCIEPGGQHDAKAMYNVVRTLLMDKSKLKRLKRRFLGDKGFCGKCCERIAALKNLIFVTPAKSNSIRKNTSSEKVALKSRSVVERVIEKFKNYKRVQYALDRSIATFNGWVQLAAVCLLPELI